jgi:cobalt transporter subunit CbtA
VRGALWGLAAFACIHLAPAAGLPPLPPGSAAADLGERQLWSAATVAATALGLWLLAGRGHAWPLRVAGLALILAPHVYGAPAPVGRNLAPPPLMRRFAAASLATTCLFWLLAGAIGGWMRRQRKH